jgi:hypothetical protein
LPEYIADCNFDNSCPYNLDELQEPDSRVYQSLAFSDLKIEGQRPEQDTRLLLFTYLLLKLAQRKKSIRHLDIGSNLGVFCLQATKNPHVELSIGLEAFEQYVDVARALAFLYDFPRARFFTFVCGEEGIAAKFENIDFVTMLAVYHHISEKDALLRDLRDLGAAYLLAEFATQDRYYSERGGLSYELQHIQNVTGYQYCHFLASTCDYNRPLILFSNDDLSYLDRRLIRSMFTKSHLTKKTLWSLINLFIAIVQKNTPQWKTSGII